MLSSDNEIGSQNWECYCPEPKLSPSEREQFLAMHRACLEDSELSHFIYQQVQGELDAIPGWKGEVTWEQYAAWMGAYRRLKRAELMAWERWKKSPNGMEQLKLEGDDNND